MGLSLPCFLKSECQHTSHRNSISCSPNRRSVLFDLKFFSPNSFKLFDHIPNMYQMCLKLSQATQKRSSAWWPLAGDVLALPEVYIAQQRGRRVGSFRNDGCCTVVVPTIPNPEILCCFLIKTVMNGSSR